jgi:hypothetical protein
MTGRSGRPQLAISRVALIIGENDVILARPMRFITGTGTAYALVRDQIGKARPLGLIDAALIDQREPFALDETCIREAGPFDAGKNGATEV